jgi:polyferredoxin
MNAKYFLFSRHVPSVHPAAMFLFFAFVLMSLLLKKAFCSWLCPVGMLSGYLWELSKKVPGRNLRLPRWADLPLRGLKHLLLAFFLLVIGAMPADAVQEFMKTPYGLVADVKMLNFSRGMGTAAAVVIMALLFLFVLVQNL